MHLAAGDGRLSGADILRLCMERWYLIHNDAYKAGMMAEPSLRGCLGTNPGPSLDEAHHSPTIEHSRHGGGTFIMWLLLALTPLSYPG